MSKRILIVWSGGYDSTCLLIDSLELGYDVYTVYFSIQNNKQKSIKEIKRRKYIKSVLRCRYGYEFTDRVIRVPYIQINSVCLSQPSLWIYGIISFLWKNHSLDEVQLGYIKSDDFWHVRYYIDDLYHILYKSMDIKVDLPPLTYPLEWVNKEDIIKRLRLSYEDISNLTWLCEGESKSYMMCGKCSTCLTNIKKIKS